MYIGKHHGADFYLSSSSCLRRSHLFFSLTAGACVHLRWCRESVCEGEEEEEEEGEEGE